MQTTPIQKDFVNAVAAEMVTWVDKAVECWMAEFESVLQDPRLTTLGRLQAVQTCNWQRALTRAHQLSAHYSRGKPAWTWIVCTRIYSNSIVSF